MFRMSREELIARLEAAANFDYAKLHPSTSLNLKLLLYVPGGMIVCSSAELPAREEVVIQEENSWHFAPLNLALSVKLPKEIPPEVEMETFLYCKDARIIPYSGREIPADSLVVPLSSVYGFSVGSVD